MSDMARQLDGANAQAALLAETVRVLAAENRRLVSVLSRIAGEDYRGPRPWSARIAEEALR